MWSVPLFWQARQGLALLIVFLCDVRCCLPGINAKAFLFSLVQHVTCYARNGGLSWLKPRPQSYTCHKSTSYGAESERRSREKSQIMSCNPTEGIFRLTGLRENGLWGSPPHNWHGEFLLFSSHVFCAIVSARTESNLDILERDLLICCR